MAFKDKLSEIRKQLVALGSREASFLKVELLFFESITLSRTYGAADASNRLLDALKKLESKEYKDTCELFRKSRQRELVIRKFVVQFKNILTEAIKNIVPQPEVIAA